MEKIIQLVLKKHKFQKWSSQRSGGSLSNKIKRIRELFEYISNNDLISMIEDVLYSDEKKCSITNILML